MIEVVQKESETPIRFFSDGKLMKDEDALRILKILYSATITNEDNLK